MDDSTQGEVILHDVPHEDYCSYMREQMLLKFFEEFHLSIEALRPNVRMIFSVYSMKVQSNI